MTAKKETAQPRLFKDAAAPGKLVYKVEEVSRLAKVDAAVIEAWEQEFPFLRAGKTGSRRNATSVRRTSRSSGGSASSSRKSP